MADEAGREGGGLSPRERAVMDLSERDGFKDVVAAPYFGCGPKEKEAAI